MLNKAVNFIKKAKSYIRLMKDSYARHDELKIQLGIIQAENIYQKTNYSCLHDLEFKVFSQFGDDGIIQYLTHHLALENKTFIEFGVENFFESNTRFLMHKDNWSGFVMDGSEDNMNTLMNAYFFWKYDLIAKPAFITKDNIKSLISEATNQWQGIDLLHIDLDGMDYWVWEALEIKPSIVIMEYNSNFGIEQAVTVPYNSEFVRTQAHHSNLYWGASLKALYLLAKKKGYTFVGCNNGGNNAYFVLNEKINNNVRETSLEQGFTIAKYRESRDKNSQLTFANHQQRQDIIHGMPVYNVETNELTTFNGR